MINDCVDFVSDRVLKCKWQLKFLNLSIVSTMLNDCVDYGKLSFRSWYMIVQFFLNDREKVFKFKRSLTMVNNCVNNLKRYLYDLDIFEYEYGKEYRSNQEIA